MYTMDFLSEINNLILSYLILSYLIEYYNIQAIHANNVSLHYLLYWQQVAYHVFGYPFTIALFLYLTVI